MDEAQVSLSMSTTTSSPASAGSSGSLTLADPSSMNQQMVSATPWDPAYYVSCSPYFSSHYQNMLQRKCEFTSEVEFEIEASKVHWSEVCDPPASALTVPESEADVVESDLVVFAKLKEQWGRFFKDGDGWTIGRKIAEGGQAEIFEAEGTCLDLHGSKKFVVKVFKRGYSLRSLEAQWPREMLNKSMKSSSGHFITSHSCPINGAMMLKGNRFAFLMCRYWGDLRKLIDLRILHNKCAAPPFQDEVAKRVIYDIAKGMKGLHEDGILHRDLKSSNVLVQWWGEDPNHFMDSEIYVAVADFECSVGVLGTAFWRAPEVLLAQKHKSEVPFTKKSDVYSYAMTCYEILTGGIPLESVDVESVLGGQRPEVPDCVDPRVKALMAACWHPDPLQRPSFVDIVDEIWKIMWT